MAHHLTHCIGPTFTEANAGIRAGVVDTGSLHSTIIIEMTSIFTFLASMFVIHTDLAKWTIGVPATTSQTHTIVTIG